jgi:hypothetical protein
MAPQASEKWQLLPLDHHRIGPCTIDGVHSEEIPRTIFNSGTPSGFNRPKLVHLCSPTVEALMKPLRLTYLLAPILLIGSPDAWAQQAPVKIVEIKEVLNLFKGGLDDWPVQHEDRWCWAATAEIIMRSYDPNGHTPWKQCIQADDAYPRKRWPRTCCDLPGSPLCNRTGWPHFEYYGFTYSARTEPLEWKELMDQIDKRQPVAVAVQYLDSDDPSISHGGHMGVIAGYTVSSDGVQKILIVDPDGFHGGMWAPFDEVFGNTSRISRHWRSYYDIRPIP